MGEASKAIPPDSQASSPSNKPFILVVDDEFTSRDLCRAFLEMDGYSVETCENSRKALALLSIKRFDLVVADLSMPDMDGVDLVKAIRYHHPHTNVIIMTAFGSVMSAVESMRAGAYDYITKPFPRDFLRATVKRCLESQNMKHEIMVMQSELFKKDKLAAVGAMAGAIAHRMRNPLSIIQMCAQYLSTRAGDNQETMQILQAIIEKVAVLENLTRDFVEYSRASRIRKSLQVIQKLMDDILQNTMPRCKVQNVRVFRQYEQNLPSLMVDADLIKEVFTNIIDNALEAMKGPGQLLIAIKLDKARKGIHVAVTNTGSILPMELREKIFEPFFTTKETGMGLGLAIVKQVIDGHGGRIQAVGDPKTQTTTFHVLLPFNEEKKVSK